LIPFETELNPEFFRKAQDAAGILEVIAADRLPNSLPFGQLSYC
jgi:hypothetical protein